MGYDYRTAAEKTATPTKMEDERLVEIFDSLKPGQTIKVTMKSVMGNSGWDTGEPTEYKVGRRGKGRNGETITLMRPGQKSVSQFVQVKLYKRKSNISDTMRVNVAIGDMAATLYAIEV